jgi:hypothetical protein
MGHHVSRIIWLAAWAGAAYGALLLEALPGEIGHDWCGPWGCLPPVQALAAMHLFWAVLLAPPVVWAWRTCRTVTLHRLGVLLVTLGLLCVALIVVREALTWYPQVPEAYRRYFGRRVLYALATLVDLPAVQLVVTGAVCWLGARRKRRAGGRPTATVAAAVSLSCSENSLCRDRDDG